MPISLIITFMLLLIVPQIAKKLFPLPKNVMVLFVTMPLAMASTPIIFFVGGFISVDIAPSPSLSTLPVTFLIIGLAISSIPTAMILRKMGRKTGTYIGLTIALAGALLAMFSTLHENFWLFVIASFLLGNSMAFIQQLRFAAMESAKDSEDIPNIISFLMVAGIFSAFIGPEVAFSAKDWIPSPHGYAGSFLALSLLIVIAMVIFSLFENPEIASTEKQHIVRPLTRIIKQPEFIIAALSAAIGYGIMSLVMTATPLSMHEMNGMSLEDTKWVIQSHIAAMYIPSFFVGFLITHLGLKKVMVAGTLIYLLMVIIGLSGQQVMHYWWSMVLLGIGWNFLFTSGTVLLPTTYNPDERFKAQAVNDFFVFAAQATASLSAGWIIFKYGWNAILYAGLPALFIMFIAIFWLYKTHPKSIYQKET